MYRTIIVSIILAAWGVSVSPAPVRAGEAIATVSPAAGGSADTSIGTVRFRDTPHGLLIEPDLERLEPGPYAVHVHEHPDCGASPDGAPAGAAGGHYDPKETGRHAGPYREGHLGDLPNIIAESNGRTAIPVLAPRVTAADIRNRALVIHAGADRYDMHSHHRHGMGAARMFCGVIR